MNDKEYDDIKAKVQKYIDKWLTPLGLKWWHVDIAYARERFDEEADGHSRDCCGYAKCSWEYADAYVVFNIGCIFAKDLRDEQIESLVIHEFCHLLVNQMREWRHLDSAGADATIKHEEAVVSRLTQVMRWVWEEARDSKPDLIALDRMA